MGALAIFDLSSFRDPRFGGKMDWKLCPFSPNSSHHKVIRDPQTLLSELDIGLIFIRVFSHSLPREEKDYSYMSNTFKECQKSCMKLQEIGNDGRLIFTRSTQPKEIVLEKSWNDGHWMRWTEYIRIINEQGCK